MQVLLTSIGFMIFLDVSSLSFSFLQMPVLTIEDATSK